jgi:3-oxoacyl-[acyl-carrier-protein] synthase II
MNARRVVVTGLGLISPVGNNVEEGWKNLLAGKSGIANITKFDASAYACRFAGEVKGFKVEDYFPAKEARHMDAFIHYGLAASIQAIRDSGIPTTAQGSAACRSSKRPRPSSRSADRGGSRRSSCRRRSST